MTDIPLSKVDEFNKIAKIISNEDIMKDLKRLFDMKIKKKSNKNERR